ncbi:hypothetical protein RB620_22780 [Paenibacillus sp. LHD-117]|uniref:hypothetical protein n=1 Tax=Paenibacillus sp. LHD-117 TaxID=3071412 RepID=UPI0027DF7C65|nr:hypothetical protein [Paenibacillus sp. LHD-117]MDQ6422257.1 hypothetical protein [Paenibacillus sp. LHD-117]
MNTSKSDTVVTVGCLILAIIGFVIILRSVEMGISAATSDLIKAESMSIDESKIRSENHIAKFRLVGGILFGVGLFLGLNKLRIRVDFRSDVSMTKMEEIEDKHSPT